MTEQEIIESRAICDAATPVRGYRVTRDGRVISEISNWRGYGSRELRQVANSHGYMRVRLGVGEDRKSYLVHKLVATAFLPPRPSAEHEVRHLDGDRTNNAAENLAWGTRAQNASDRDSHGRTARGVRNGAARLNYAKVAAIRELSLRGESQRTIAALMGCSQKSVWRVIHGETWGSIA